MSRHVMECLGMSRVTIEDGKVVEVTEPRVRYCPLFAKRRGMEELNKESIRENIEYRISSFGMCTEDRVTTMDNFLNFGISETLCSALKNGKIDRPTLGIGMVDLSNVTTDQQQSVLKLPSNVNKGVVVMQVESGSAADSAGVKQYDVITQLGDTKVTNANTLRAALYKYKVGDSAKVTYYRNGKQQTSTVHLTKASSGDNNQSSQQDDGQ